MLLEIQNLRKYFPITGGILSRTVGNVRAVEDVSFSLDKNDVLGLVGESGCGKSTVAHCVLRLLQPDAGKVLLDGEDILQMSNRRMQEVRRRIQVIFQDPLSSLNPRMTVGSIIREPMDVHQLYSREERNQKVERLLEQVGLPVSAAGRYPHEFSGGQCQRIGVARALALDPDIIVADEPVSALDVSVQAQIINLLTDLKQKMGLSYLFIAHDLSVVRHISNRIAVMYLGRIVEMGDADTVCFDPKHPYTKALLSAVPTPVVKKRESQQVPSGDVPSPAAPPPGCTFHPRCPIARPDCSRTIPSLDERTPGHLVRCPYSDDAG